MNKAAEYKVVSINVDETNYNDASERILSLAESASPAYVCVANVHMTMEAYDDSIFAEIVNSADLVVPDGMPLVWMLRLLGARSHGRVRGPDLVLHLAHRAASLGLPVAAYGGSESALQGFVANMKRAAPTLQIGEAISPPYRQLTDEEETEYRQRLIDSDARIIFVGLGCPKQERWMAKHSPAINAVMVGVGAAFDFHSGQVREAPHWMQDIGLEWLYRLSQDPKRLWRRYFVHNPRFVALSIRQLLLSGRPTRGQ